MPLALILKDVKRRVGGRFTRNIRLTCHCDINLSGFGFHSLGLFLPFAGYRGTCPSWCLGLPCFVGHGGWGASMGDACMFLGRRLVPDVCGYTVLRIASVDVCSAGNVLRLLSFVDHLLLFFFSNWKYRNAHSFSFSYAYILGIIIN